MTITDGVQVNYCGNCDVFDAPAAFAAPAFAALSALYIDANEVELFIPGSLQLRTLHIAAETLTVHFLLSCSLRSLDRYAS